MRKIYFESLPLKSPLFQEQNSPSCWLSVLLWEGELTYMFTTGEAEAGVLENIIQAMGSYGGYLSMGGTHYRL